MNRTYAMGTLAMVAALLALAVPASAWPDCTCDPNPITNLAHCLADGTYCPSAPGVPGWVPDPDETIYDLTHPTPPPCTCDPLPIRDIFSMVQLA